MCLKLKEKFKKRDIARAFTKKKPLVTTQDIKVYKVLRVSEKGELKFFSPYREMQYKSGKENKISKFSYQYSNVTGTWRVAINKGLHSYIKKEFAIAFVALSKGKHVYAIVKCIIPKGTPYYKNTYSYASLQLDLPSLSFKVDEVKKIMTPNNGWEFHSNDKASDLQVILPI